MFVLFRLFLFLLGIKKQQQQTSPLRIPTSVKDVHFGTSGPVCRTKSLLSTEKSLEVLGTNDTGD